MNLVDLQHALFDDLVMQLEGRMQLTEAELLLGDADMLADPPDHVLEYVGPKDYGYLLALAALALDFSRMDKGLIFCAIAEGWDRQRIVREMY